MFVFAVAMACYGYFLGGIVNALIRTFHGPIRQVSLLPDSLYWFTILIDSGLRGFALVARCRLDSSRDSIGASVSDTRVLEPTLEPFGDAQLRHLRTVLCVLAPSGLVARLCRCPSHRSHLQRCACIPCYFSGGAQRLTRRCSEHLPAVRLTFQMTKPFHFLPALASGRRRGSPFR